MQDETLYVYLLLLGEDFLSNKGDIFNHFQTL